MALEPHSALLVVDVQNDFCPGGALPVPQGDEIIGRINQYIGLFGQRGRPVLASRDWHPLESKHFATHGGTWPVHCVQNTPGAAFHPDLQLPPTVIVISKGMQVDEDAYSAFVGYDPEGRSLQGRLKQQKIERLYVCGLALDYCVQASALDAAAAGLGVTVLVDATRAVNVRPHDAELAIEKLLRGGVSLAVYEMVAE